MTNGTQDDTKRRKPQALSLGQWIQKNCKTQHEAAVFLGIREQNLGRLIAGKQDPKGETVARIVYNTRRLYDEGRTVGCVPLWKLIPDDVRAELFGAKGRP